MLDYSYISQSNLQVDVTEKASTETPTPQYSYIGKSIP
jgi:hypothetical protein